MKPVNRNLVLALTNALKSAELYKQVHAEAAEAKAARCEEAYTEIIKDAEKAVTLIQNVIEAHVKEGKWG